MSDSHQHHHHHQVSTSADTRYLKLALALLLAFMLVEVVVGVLASSLALISDAGHMLSDAGAIALALFAMTMAKRPATGSYTFGFKRVEILSAQANGITLLLLALWFIVEAILRLIEPPQVDGALVFAVALIGIVVNALAVWTMAKADRRSLNIEGSFQHIVTDLYAFIATAVAGAIIWLTGWNRVDSIAALVVAALMLRAGYALVRDSGRIFLEAVPRGVEPDQVCKAMLDEAHVTRIDDLHIWEVTSGMPALSAHLYVSPEVDCHDKRREVANMLHERFGIAHITLQTDHAKALPEGQQDASCQQCG